MPTKDQQVKHVVEGMALGVLAQGVEAVSSAKQNLELAFNHAWSRWAPATRFPSIAGPRTDPGNLFWIGLNRSEGRQGTRAAWRSGRWCEPYVTYEDWTVDECLEFHADERASVQDWQDLGRLFVSRFGPEEVRRVS
ncbi:hypothetical protein ACQPYA_30580 [Micromonospora sp. CA-263727]|uniref:hypothetical protein n=1 Tax=Micromonospora sp. CA-263727 TaxID=3239967 RepID=UPI003D901B7D